MTQDELNAALAAFAAAERLQVEPEAAFVAWCGAAGASAVERDGAWHLPPDPALGITDARIDVFDGRPRLSYVDRHVGIRLAFTITDAGRIAETTSADRWRG